jgi:hypothetical protein
MSNMRLALCSHKSTLAIFGRSQKNQEKPENRGAGPSAQAPLFSGILSVIVKH